MDEKSDRPRWWHEGALSPEAVSLAVADVLAVWWEWLPWMDVTQPFSGALEEWPHRLTEGLAVARREWQAIGAWQQWRHARRK